MNTNVRNVIVAAFAGLLAGSASAEGPTATQLLDHTTLGRLQIGQHTLIQNFPLADAGRFTFDLTRFSVLAPNARVFSQDGDQITPIPDTNLVLLRGSIVGEDDDSTVFLAVGRYGVNGFVSRSGGEFFSISSGQYVPLPGPQPEVVVTSNWDLDYINSNFCQVDDNDPKYNPVVTDVDQRPVFDLSSRGATGCNLATVAIDSDYEFTHNKFGGNASASTDYALTLLGATSTIYQRDVGVTISVGFIRTWTSNTDPYSGNDLNQYLDDVRNEWRINHADVSRVIVHALSGRSLGGGVAYLNVLCSNNLGYGVAAVDGHFPNPPQDHNSQNWDIMVVPHEMGHNFGSPHTHDYSPQIDGCGDGDCTGAYGGTIMSYCHLCSGGMRNIVLQFHPRVQDVIEARVAAAGCITSISEDTTAIDDTGVTLTNVPVNLDVLENDAGESCATPEFQTIQNPTANGGSVTIVNGSPYDELRYTPPASFHGTDTFTYTLTGGSTATVTVDVESLRNPDHPANPQPGVAVDYYLLSNPTSMPDFSSMTPLASDVVPNIDFDVTTGLFATSPLGNNVGAVFDGYVQVPFPGLYTFETESDDGSRLWIGDHLVVDNDGLHGMQARQGPVGLMAGLHHVRVEFFEGGGDAGLIVRNNISPNAPVVIPASAWFYSTQTPCVPDWNQDGSLDFFDVQAFLNAFSSHNPAADLNSDGSFDFFDVQNFLNVFSDGCP